MHQNRSGFRALLKRLYLSIQPSHRLIVLDYPAVPKPIYTTQNPHQKLHQLIAANEADYVALLTACKKYVPDLQTIKRAGEENNPTKPVWNNGYLPGLDMVMLYTILNEFKPATYIEIGSGTSTRVAYKAKKENSLNLTIISIDPAPRQDIIGLADEWQNKELQAVPKEIFYNLKANDIVFFDGTHRLLPNSDVMYFFLEVLPALPKGILVQLHDIYLPYDYPQFMCNRYYSENYILGAVLLAAPERYKIISPNFYISENAVLAGLIATVWEHPNTTGVERHGGSFWFRVQ